MVSTFLVAFVFSFLGSIPPGAINLSVVQLSIEKKYRAALRFALAAAIVEFPYAFIAVKFQEYLLSQPMIMHNLQLLAGVVMLILGVINLYSALRTPTQLMEKFKQSGFRKGLIISILNPLAIPFWIGVTAYLNSIGWIHLEGNVSILWYISGISLGTFGLLVLVAFLGKKASIILAPNDLVRIIPGVIFLLLGSYALLKYFNLI